jgi:para-nitrobenzyl esterase
MECPTPRPSPVVFVQALPRVAAFAFLLVLGTANAAEPAPPAASVTGGSVVGQSLPGDQGVVFKGIPFAQPPVGALRWREPQPVLPWAGVRDALKSGPPAKQAGFGWNDAMAAASSEDCLYLDVWSPGMAPAHAPVMLWIHGGGNVGGAGGFDPLYDGRALIRHGVVLVVVEYRLGALGFFAHPELTKESPHHASGNYGVLDLVAALQWVHANIASFGGDPANVTIFGQSAGGTDVLALMATPLSRGLVAHAIAESPPLPASMTQSLAAGEAAGLGASAALAGTGPKDLAALRALPAEDAMKLGVGQHPMTTEGWVFPVSAYDTWQRHGELRVPLIVGSNAVEFSFGGGPAAVEGAIREQFGDLAPRALALYGPSISDPLYGNGADQLGSDFFRETSTIEGEWHSEAGSPTWHYSFDRAIPPQPRVAHSGDLPYVFGNLFLKGTGSLAGDFTDVDRRLSGVIQGYWTTFARTGNPNGEGRAEWDAYATPRRAFMEFTADGRVVAGTDERAPYRQLFRESMDRPAAQAAMTEAPSTSFAVISAADPRFHYEGLLDLADPASPGLVWEASTASIDFDGRMVALRLGGLKGDVFLDAAVDGVTTLVGLHEKSPTQVVPLKVQGAGLHHLELFKRTEASAGSVHFEGVEIGAGAHAFAPPAKEYRMRMLILGDSITAGACDLDGDKDQWEDRSTHDAAFSWAALTASAFSAEYRNISVSGIGLAAGYDNVLVGQVWDHVYPDADSPLADLSAWTPDVVLVLLGDNDDSYPRDHKLPFPSAFGRKYSDLVHEIRAAYPRAQIVLLNGAMWAGLHSDDLRTAWGAVVKDLEKGDPAISDYTFNHWTGNHPRVADHKALAEELDAWLRRQPFMAAR